MLIAVGHVSAEDWNTVSLVYIPDVIAAAGGGTRLGVRNV
jgi:hypothetical protein